MLSPTRLKNHSSEIEPDKKFQGLASLHLRDLMPIRVGVINIHHALKKAPLLFLSLLSRSAEAYYHTFIRTLDQKYIENQLKSEMSKSKKLENNPDANLAQIGNYIFQKTVGEGNFAKVKLAKHKITHQEVSSLFTIYLKLLFLAPNIGCHKNNR